MTLLRLPRDDVVRSDSKSLIVRANSREIESSTKSRNQATSLIAILPKYGYRAKPDFIKICVPVEKKGRDGEIIERN